MCIYKMTMNYHSILYNFVISRLYVPLVNKFDLIVLYETFLVSFLSYFRLTHSKSVNYLSVNP
jgi:hypothetical protein